MSSRVSDERTTTEARVKGDQTSSAIRAAAAAASGSAIDGARLALTCTHCMSLTNSKIENSRETSQFFIEKSPEIVMIALSFTVNDPDDQAQVEQECLLPEPVSRSF